MLYTRSTFQWFFYQSPPDDAMPLVVCLNCPKASGQLQSFMDSEGLDIEAWPSKLHVGR